MYISPTKEALDDMGNKMFTTYRTYSMAIAWNLNAQDLTDAQTTFPAIPGVPMDGDALARSSARILRNAEAWSTLAAETLEMIRNNHADANTVAPR